MRFYSGVNLNSYKNQKVNVIVKVRRDACSMEVVQVELQYALCLLSTRLELDEGSLRRVKHYAGLVVH